MPYTTTKYTANADIRTYMTDNLVSQSKLAESMGISVWKVNAMLKTELSQREKEDILRRIDAIAAERLTEDPSPMGGGYGDRRRRYGRRYKPQHQVPDR